MSSNAASLTQAKAGAEPSMEEILASIRRIIADDTLGTKKDEPAARAPEPAAMDEPDGDVLDLAEVATIPSQPAMTKLPEIEMPMPVDVDVDMMAEPMPAPMMAMEPEPVFVAPPAPAPTKPIASMGALENRILSDQTGAMVSQAFQALSRNVTIPTGRTLEEIVIDLVRPMLKGWLDENLPGIVERLIKAEIERVARGG